MAVLAPAQAHLVPLEEIPESVFTDPGTAVLYPDDTAVSGGGKKTHAQGGLRC